VHPLVEGHLCERVKHGEDDDDSQHCRRRLEITPTTAHL
jgi:hypothetical protein